MQYQKITYIIRLEDSMMAAFFLIWVQHDKPCSITYKKPKTDGLTAVIVTIDSTDSAEFLLAAKKQMRFTLTIKNA